MKLGYAIELVIALAVGLGVWWYLYSGMGPEPWQSFLVDWVYTRVFVFLSAVSLVGGAGLFVESLRGRSPQPWGCGRWVWAIMALGTVVSLVHFASVTRSSLWNDIWLLSIFVRAGGEDMTAFLVALGITARLLRAPISCRADAREWAGRLLGIAMIFQTLLESTETWWLDWWLSNPAGTPP